MSVCKKMLSVMPMVLVTSMCRCIFLFLFYEFGFILFFLFFWDFLFFIFFVFIRFVWWLITIKGTDPCTLRVQPLLRAIIFIIIFTFPATMLSSSCVVLRLVLMSSSCVLLLCCASCKICISVGLGVYSFKKLHTIIELYVWVYLPFFWVEYGLQICANV